MFVSLLWPCGTIHANPARCPVWLVWFCLWSMGNDTLVVPAPDAAQLFQSGSSPFGGFRAKGCTLHPHWKSAAAVEI